MTACSYGFGQRADTSAVRTLLTSCGLPAEDIDQHIEHFVVAKKGAELAGVIGIELLGPDALLRSFAVASPHRGLGIGRRLYDHILAHAHLCGVQELYLLTQSAQPYFSKLGFRTVSRSHVAPQIQGTKEFGMLCPSSATCMAKRIAAEARYFPNYALQLRADIPGANMWAVTLDKTQLSYFEVGPHSRFERHAHSSEQITMVLEGELYFELDDRLIRVGKGEVMAIPSNVPHAVFTGGLPAKAIDAWSPVMEKYRA